MKAVGYVLAGVVVATAIAFCAYVLEWAFGNREDEW